MKQTNQVTLTRTNSSMIYNVIFNNYRLDNHAANLETHNTTRSYHGEIIHVIHNMKTEKVYKKENETINLFKIHSMTPADKVCKHKSKTRRRQTQEDSFDGWYSFG